MFLNSKAKWLRSNCRFGLSNEKLLFISKEYNGSKIGIIFNFSPYYDLVIDYKQYGFENVVGQIVVNNSEKYIGEQKDGTIKMPSYSIAIVKWGKIKWLD